MKPNHRTHFLSSTSHRLLHPLYTAVIALVLGLAGASQAQTPETVVRKIYFPASALSYWGSAITEGQYGLSIPSTTTIAPKLVLPRPADAALADPTEPIKVTLYFAVPSASVPNNYRWQLQAGSLEVDSTSGATGWDSLDYYHTENGTLITYPAAGSYTNLVKSQTWTAKWSSTYGTWYFGSGVTTANDFTDNPIWHFGFVRGKAVNNGETNTGNFIILGVGISYLAYR